MKYYYLSKFITREREKYTELFKKMPKIKQYISDPRRIVSIRSVN